MLCVCPLTGCKGAEILVLHCYEHFSGSVFGDVNIWTHKLVKQSFLMWVSCAFSSRIVKNRKVYFPLVRAFFFYASCFLPPTSHLLTCLWLLPSVWILFSLVLWDTGKKKKKKTFPQICYLGSLLLCVAYLVVIISLFPSPLIPRANVQIDDTLKLMAA